MSDTPRTEAGRRLWAWAANDEPVQPDDWYGAILDIEAEAAATSSPVGNGEPPGLRDAAQKALDFLTMDAAEYAVAHGEDAVHSDTALIAELSVALESTRDTAPGLRGATFDPSAVLREVFEFWQGRPDLAPGAALLDRVYRATPPSEAPSGIDPDGEDTEEVNRAGMMALTLALPTAWWTARSPGVLVNGMMAWLDANPDRRADLARMLSPTPGQGDGLDAAWKAAEAALPNGDEHRDHPLFRYGTWRMKVVGPWNIEHGGHRPTWQAIAEPYNATGQGLDREIEALGPTPAAALRALAAALATPAPDREP